MTVVLYAAGGLCLLYYLLVGATVSFRTSVLYAWLLAAAWCFAAAYFPAARAFFLIPAAVFLVPFAVFLVFALSAAHPEKAGHYDAILLFGARTDGTLPPEMIRSRVRTAAEAFRASGKPVVISGGRVFRETEAEAETFAKLLRKEGVPDDRMILETASKTTVENLLAVRPLLPDGCKTLLAVTSPHHVFRVRRAAAKAMPGVRFDFAPAAFSSPALFHLYLREFFTFCTDLFRGRL